MQNQDSNDKSALRAVVRPLFPTMDSLQDVVDLAKAKFPVEQHNDLLSLLFTYHNTLLAQVQCTERHIK